jgi:hypothetical protein
MYELSTSSCKRVSRYRLQFGDRFKPPVAWIVRLNRKTPEVPSPRDRSMRNYSEAIAVLPALSGHLKAAVLALVAKAFDLKQIG